MHSGCSRVVLQYKQLRAGSWHVDVLGSLLLGQGQEKEVDGLLVARGVPIGFPHVLAIRPLDVPLKLHGCFIGVPSLDAGDLVSFGAHLVH